MLGTCHDRIDSIDIDLPIRFTAIYSDPPISHLPPPTLPPSRFPLELGGGGPRQRASSIRSIRSSIRFDAGVCGWLAGHVGSNSTA